jgi:hypothetical protein
MKNVILNTKEHNHVAIGIPANSTGQKRILCVAQRLVDVMLQMFALECLLNVHLMLPNQLAPFVVRRGEFVVWKRFAMAVPLNAQKISASLLELCAEPVLAIVIRQKHALDYKTPVHPIVSLLLAQLVVQHRERVTQKKPVMDFPLIVLSM